MAGQGTLGLEEKLGRRSVELKVDLIRSELFIDFVAQMHDSSPILELTIYLPSSFRCYKRMTIQKFTVSKFLSIRLMFDFQETNDSLL